MPALILRQAAEMRSEARRSRQRATVIVVVYQPKRKVSRGGDCSLYAGGLKIIYGENDRNV